MERWILISDAVSEIAQELMVQIERNIEILINKQMIEVRNIDGTRKINILEIHQTMNVINPYSNVISNNKLLLEIINRLDSMQAQLPIVEPVNQNSINNEINSSSSIDSIPNRNLHPKNFYPKKLQNEKEPFRKLTYMEFNQILKKVREYYHLRIDPISLNERLSTTFAEYLYCYLYNPAGILRANIDHEKNKITTKLQKPKNSHKYYFPPLKKQFSSLKLLVLTIWESDASILHEIIKNTELFQVKTNKNQSNNEQMSIFSLK